jgi:hypothetical protein
VVLSRCGGIRIVSFGASNDSLVAGFVSFGESFDRARFGRMLPSVDQGMVCKLPQISRFVSPQCPLGRRGSTAKSPCFVAFCACAVRLPERYVGRESLPGLPRFLT